MLAGFPGMQTRICKQTWPQVWVSKVHYIPMTPRGFSLRLIVETKPFYWVDIGTVWAPIEQSRCSINGQPFPAVNIRKCLVQFTHVPSLATHCGPSNKDVGQDMLQQPGVKMETPFHQTIERLYQLLL